jgi:hypothetical protein
MRMPRTSTRDRLNAVVWATAAIVLAGGLVWVEQRQDGTPVPDVALMPDPTPDPPAPSLESEEVSESIPVIGAVRAMVEIPTDRVTRVDAVLRMAGAFALARTDPAAIDLTIITVRRTAPDGRVIKIRVDADRILKGNTTQNIVIHPGDLVIVPPTGRLPRSR